MAAKEHRTSETNKEISLSPAPAEKVTEAKEVLLLSAPVNSPIWEAKPIQPQVSISPAVRALQSVSPSEYSQAVPITRTSQIAVPGKEERAETSKAFILAKQAFVKASSVQIQGTLPDAEKGDFKPPEIVVNPVGANPASTNEPLFVSPPSEKRITPVADEPPGSSARVQKATIHESSSHIQSPASDMGEKVDSKQIEAVANPVAAKRAPPENREPVAAEAPRSSSAQALKDEESRQKEARPLEIAVNAPLAKPQTPENKPEGPKESRLADAIGLAVAGPFYSAAKELGALKNDPLTQKLFGIFQNKGNKDQGDAEPESSKSEIVQAVRDREERASAKESISIKADEVLVKAEKATFEYSAPGSDIKAAAASGDEDSSLVEVERKEKRDKNKSSRKKRGRRGRRAGRRSGRSGRRRGGRRAGRRGGRSGRLGKALKKTKIGKGLSTGFDAAKSVGSKIGGLVSESPVGKIGGKAVGALGKSSPFKMLGKAGKFMGRIAGKAALPLALATTAFDMFDGWNNASEITGKDDKDLTFWDKIKASGAKAAEGLSFGMIPAGSFLGKPDKETQKPVDVKKTTLERGSSTAMSGTIAPGQVALTAANSATMPIAAKTGVARRLTSPLKTQGSSLSGTVKTTDGQPKANSAGLALQGDKATLQKLDVLIGELRNLRKELGQQRSGGPSPVSDPFLRETITETERQFNTW